MATKEELYKKYSLGSDKNQGDSPLYDKYSKTLSKSSKPTVTFKKSTSSQSPSPTIPKVTQTKLSPSEPKIKGGSISQYNPSFLDKLKDLFIPKRSLVGTLELPTINKLRDSDVVQSLASSVAGQSEYVNSLIGSSANAFIDKIVDKSYEKADERGELPYGIPKNPEKYVPKTMGGKIASFGGAFAGDAPIMPINLGSNLLKAKTALNPVAREVISQGLTGGVLGTAQGIVEGDNISDIAKRAAFGTALGGTLGGATKGIPKVASKVRGNGLEKQVSQFIPELKINPLEEVQKAYKTPSLRDVRQQELERIFADSSPAERTGAILNSPSEYFQNAANQTDFENLFGGPIKKYSFKSKTQQMYEDLFSGKPVPENASEYFGKIGKEDLQKLWGNPLRRYSIKPRKQIEYENLFSGDDVFFSPKRETAKANATPKMQLGGNPTQAELESIIGKPLKSYKTSSDVQNIIQEIEAQLDNMVNDIAVSLRQADNAVAGEKNVLQQVKNIGGIAPSRTGAFRGEYNQSVPIWLRNRDGRPIDEVADELGMTASDLLAEMGNQINKVGRKSTDDYLNEAYMYAMNEPQYQGLQKTLQMLKQAMPEQRALSYKPSLKPREAIPNPLSQPLITKEVPASIGKVDTANVKLQPRDLSRTREGKPYPFKLRPREISEGSKSSVSLVKTVSKGQEFIPRTSEGIKPEPRIWTNRDGIPISETPRIEPLPKQEVKTLATPSPIKPLRQSAASIDNGVRLADEGTSPIPRQAQGQLGTLSEPEITPGKKERGVNKNLRTDENRPTEMRKSHTENPLEYDPINNPETLAKAQAIYDEGLESAIAKFDELNNNFSPEAPPLLKLIADDLYKQGNAARADELISTAAARATQAGQYSQAWRILRSAKDSTAFNMTLQKELNRLNKEGSEAYGKKWSNVKLTPEESTAIGKLKPNDTKASDELYEQIQNRIANELPSDIWEKVNAIRHFSMLFNIRTNVRNVSGNAIMLAMRKASQKVSGLLQGDSKILKPLQKAMRYDAADRTQSFIIKKEYKDAASEYFNANKKELLDGANKYLENIKLNMPNKRVFKNDTPENLRKFTYTLLEMGDTPFFRNAYVDRLASYAQAKGIKDFARLPKEAFDTAFKEAQEATYKDTSKLASYLNSVKNPGANASLGARAASVLTEAVLPFTKTPINIVKRGIQYSPAGVINGIAKGGAKGIDELAKGLTGTTAVGLGYLLAQSGILTGGPSDDKDLREYNKDTGNAPFSILGKYSYNWAEPFSTPLVIGVEMYNAVKDNKDKAAKMEQIITSGTDQQKKEYISIIAEGLIDGFKASGDAILDMSLLQGVQNILGNPQGVMEGLTQVPQNYAGQFVPTLLSQTAKIIDPVVRQTYIKGDKLGSFKSSLLSKIPGASMSLEPKLTPYGEEIRRVENPALRFMGEAVSPGIISRTQIGDPKVDAEIQRLADLGYKRQIPTIVPNYVEGTKKYPRLELTPQETTRYQKRTGELTLPALKKVINSSDYRNPNLRSDKFKGLSAESAREKILSEIISEAKAKAKAEIVKSRGY